MPRRTKKPLTTSGSKKRNTVASDGSEISDSEASDDLMTYNIIPSYFHANKPGDPDNVRKIFKLSMPGYNAAKDHTKSYSTRVPGRYDKHLDKCLRPASAAYCPGLNLQIGEIADRSYQKYIQKFGPPPKSNRTNPGHVLQALNQYGAPMVKLETGIIHHYAKVIPNIVLPIVSELAFETSSWQTRYLEWTPEQSNNRAVADAALRLDLDYPPPGSTHHYCPRASLDQGNHRLLAGEASVRDETPMLNCSVCDHPSRNELKDVAQYFPNVMLYEFKNLLAGRYEHMIALLEITRDDNVPWEECDSQTCKHDTIDFRVTGSRTGFDAAKPIIHLEAADWTEPPVQLNKVHRTAARHIFQQIWSEMVEKDATFLVLSCGNIDMIVARSRAERVLYLGDPIFTTKPGYIGMLVGLSIASIRDAIDRAAQLRACENASNLPLSWTKYDHVKNDEPDLKPSSLDFGQMLRECPELCLVPKNGSGVEKGPVQNLYKRYPKQGSHGRLTIRIEPITKLKDDANIFIGVVKWKKRVLKDRFIVKIAEGKNAVENLARESCILRSLMGSPESCKIPFMYGFFVAVSRKTGIPHAVLLEQYVGNRPSEELSQSQQDSLRNTLKHMGERGYEYSGIMKPGSVMARAGKNGEEEVYLVRLSRSNALKRESSGDTGSFSALDRACKRQKTNRPPIYLGPIPNIAMSPRQAFEHITTWMKELEAQATLPETAYCIGWADTLPDWLEIEILPRDADKFEELWDSRPDDLRGIVCMNIGAWW